MDTDGGTLIPEELHAEMDAIFRHKIPMYGGILGNLRPYPGITYSVPCNVRPDWVDCRNQGWKFWTAPRKELDNALPSDDQNS